MLDLPQLVRKSPEVHRVVLNYLLERRDTYLSSECRKRLKKRYDRLKASIDMSSSAAAITGAGGNNWMSKLTFPLVREIYLLTRAMTKKNFRADPLITLVPEVGTIYDNAVHMQDVLALNLKSTLFRETGFESIVDDVSRYGASVSVAQFVSNQQPVKKTVDTLLGPQQQMQYTNKKNVVNTPIHILNYAQNPMISTAEKSDWKCIVENIPISVLISEARTNPDVYIKENLQVVIKNAKSNAFRDDNYHHDDKEIRDYNKAGVDRLKFWATIHINGNEDNNQKYYVEIIGDKIIRLEENPLDEDIDPVTIYTMRNRPEYWWGNAWGEDVMPQENFVKIMMNMKAEQALKVLERYVFYAKGTIDVADLNNRHLNGGFVPVDAKGNLQMQNMIYEYQGKNTDTADTDWLFREIKEQVQKSSPKPDFLRNGNKGGLANNTATAAGIIDEMTELLESDCMEVFSYGLTNMGRKNAIILQQFLGDKILILPDPKKAPQEFWKREILGNFVYSVVSTLHKNKVQDAIRLQNVLTQMLNFKGSGDPTWQNVDMVPIARKWISTLDIGDVDQVMPVQASQNMIMGGMMAGQQNNQSPQMGGNAADSGALPQSPMMQGAMNNAA